MTRVLSRVGLAIVAIVVVLAALPAYGRLTESSRISAALAKQLTTGQPYYSVQVQFDFRPQYFNIQKLQSIGTLAGTKGDTCKVLDLTVDQVHRIAGFYWVKRVVTLAEAQ